ncbi:hypothetical protein Poli38472_011847 [Pythium oligandrum]|uniref:Uncharacterized protein n=1 Tax=Pythium oligandrum TaxID=41045 RepID=A0A8K1FES8_PYTOL|nr:hypothetical protein Poli38472_011847 [Pythium oligandrum]|eukprot:TMW58259.1 hypothetical protein Poli38472_011847 [Pythium oligandrum]
MPFDAQVHADELAAALASVDEFDFAAFDRGLESSSSGLTAQYVRVPSVADTPSRKLTVKEELQYLRGTVKQLETRLAILQNGLAVSSSQRKNRQFQQLERSEHENTRLRGLVEEQLRLISGLEHMLKKKRSKTLSWYTDSMLRAVPGDFIDPLSDPVIEAELDRCVDNMVNATDRILADPRYQTDLREPLHLSRMVADSGRYLSLETLEGHLFPSTYETAADALWGLWSATTKSKVHTFRHLEVVASGDRICRQVVGDFNVHGNKIPFRIKLIARRIVQADRIVIPTVMLIDPVQMNGETHSGLFLRERGWNVFHSDPIDDGAKVACRKSYFLTMPEAFGPSSSGVDIRLTESLIQMTHMRLSLNNECLENRLIASFDKVQITE